jgi:hypothetical protein
VYYAHLLAYRGRVLSGVDEYSSSDTQSNISAVTEGSIVLHQNFDTKTPMFYV